jgi:type IV pilus assembly protein PilV
MKARTRRLGARTQRGASLMEVLIAVVVLSMGLVGVSALTITSVRNNQNANIRTRVSVLVEDFADRMRRNGEGLKQGYYDTVSVNGNTAATASCASNCTAQATANNDAQLLSQRLGEMFQSSSATVSCSTASAGQRACLITVNWWESIATREASTSGTQQSVQFVTEV